MTINDKIFTSKLNESEFQIKPLEKKVDKKTSIMWGTYRSLINNAVKGVSAGHEKILELSGVGFRANLKGEVLNLQLGFSHDINFKIPKEVKITVEKQTIIKINGVDKELVSKIASELGIQHRQALFGFEDKYGARFPVFGGIVVLKKDSDIIEAALDQLEHEDQQHRENLRVGKVMKNWRTLVGKVITRLSLRERYKM